MVLSFLGNRELEGCLVREPVTQELGFELQVVRGKDFHSAVEDERLTFLHHDALRQGYHVVLRPYRVHR